jgi:hypothetical protein
MKSLLTAALVLAVTVPAMADSGRGFRAVVATPEMNRKMDGVTPGVTPVGAKVPNDGRRAKCETVTGNFAYLDGTVRRQSMSRCE